MPAIMSDGLHACDVGDVQDPVLTSAPFATSCCTSLSGEKCCSSVSTGLNLRPRGTCEHGNPLTVTMPSRNSTSPKIQQVDGDIQTQINAVASGEYQTFVGTMPSCTILCPIAGHSVHPLGSSRPFGTTGRGGNAFSCNHKGSRGLNMLVRP